MDKPAQPLAKHRVFLSYSHSDRAPAEKLKRLFEARSDVRLFTEDNLSAGEDWQAKLMGELRSCDIFSVVVSPDTLASTWVLQELGAALALQKPILSVLTSRSSSAKLPMPIDARRIAHLEDLTKPTDLDVWLSEPAPLRAA